MIAGLPDERHRSSLPLAMRARHAVLLVPVVLAAACARSTVSPGMVCVPASQATPYAAGSWYCQEVTVSVLNASGREGLATRTLAELEDAGFAPGQTANAPAGTTLTTPAEIWASDPESPAAKLVRRRLGKVPVRSDVVSPAKGITIVVGESFGELQDGPTSVTVDAASVVCSPPVG